MSRRTTGAVLIAAASLLYVTRFIAAAIFGTGFTTWSTKHFNTLLGYVDQGLTTWSIAALAAGIIYLVWAEISDWRKE